MPRRLSETHKTAFVSGASSGLGLAFARMLAADGVRVWGSSRDPGRLAAAQPGLLPVGMDLARPAAAEAAFRRAAEEAGGAFDIVVNNAGYGVFGAFGEGGFAPWQAQIEAMLAGTLRIAHAAWGPMLARNRGILVNVSSLAAEFPLPFMSGYNVCKAGLSAFSESLIFESRGTGVAVIDFRPGDYRTGFNDGMKAASAFGGAAPGGPPRLGGAWRALESNLRSAPGPSRAAADLRRALLRGKSGVVRSGSFFQARLAPFLARLAPAAALRAAAARYFGRRPPPCV